MSSGPVRFLHRREPRSPARRGWAAPLRDKAQLLPSKRSETALALARIEYQALVHRVSDAPVRSAVQQWEQAALLWFGDDDDGTAALEAATWTAAVEAAGLAVRATE